MNNKKTLQYNLTQNLIAHFKTIDMNDKEKIVELEHKNVILRRYLIERNNEIIELLLKIVELEEEVKKLKRYE